MAAMELWVTPIHSRATPILQRRSKPEKSGPGVKTMMASSVAASNHFSANFQPQKVRGLESVKIKAAAGSGVASMAITEDGALWVWGSSKRGQLGLGAGITNSLLPQQVPALAGKQVLQVSLGWGHALACTVDGELYSWGYHDNGRLGYRLAQDQNPPPEPEKGGDVGDHLLRQQWQKEDAPVLQWEPKLVEFSGSLKIVKVACGLDHSLALTEDGLVYSFGDNTTDQLGREAPESSNPETVGGELSRKQVVSVGAGWGHSVAVEKSSPGEVYSWGWSSAFQLGHSRSGSLPRRVEGLEDEQFVWAGAGRVHSLALSSKHELWTWGCGRNGRLGTGSSRDEKLPVCPESKPRVLEAACGFDHNVLLVEL